MSRPILVVGAGFAGATYARELAEAGYAVSVIDVRPHIAGNAFDRVVQTGQRIHQYGPHLFHTSNQRVVDWITRFGAFTPYEHRVQALLPNQALAPLPINRQTINAVFDTNLRTPNDVAVFLRTQAVSLDCVTSAADHLLSTIGTRLTDLFFRPYNRKMWQLELEELDAAVVRRVPLRHDDEDRYFPSDRFQALPVAGYTALVGEILDHPRIETAIETAFVPAMLKEARHCFNSMAIDEFFDSRFGPLPYRSIRFHHRQESAEYRLGTATTINFTDSSPLTRQTDWSLLPCHQIGSTPYKTLTVEEPCDFRENAMERYYPVKTSDARFDAVYQRYRSLALERSDMTFIGRCGTYQYLDMHQVINQSLLGVHAWIDAQRDRPAEAGL
jgi:UDP-galactopyranose mutase